VSLTFLLHVIYLPVLGSVFLDHVYTRRDLSGFVRVEVFVASVLDGYKIKPSSFSHFCGDFIFKI